MPLIPAIACTPNSLVTHSGCFECLSESELWQVLALVLAKMNGHTAGDLSGLVQQAECLRCSLSDRQLFQGIVWLLNDAYNANESVTGLKADLKCVACADPKAVRAAVTAQACVWINANG